jgi:hypothetical protein
MPRKSKQASSTRKLHNPSKKYSMKQHHQEKAWQASFVSSFFHNREKGGAAELQSREMYNKEEPQAAIAASNKAQYKETTIQRNEKFICDRSFA